MSKIILRERVLISFLFVFTGCSGEYFGQHNIEISTTSIQNGSIVSEWNWGILSTECIDRRTVTLVNRLDRQLQLTSFRTACGCSVMNATPMGLKPNDTFSFEFLYDPRGRSEGKNTASGTIDIQDEKLREIRLFFDVFVKRRATAIPPRAVFHLSSNGKASQTFSIINQHKDYIALHHIDLNLDSISHTLQKGVKIEEEITFDLAVDLQNNTEDQNGNLQLFEKDSECPFLSIPIDINVYDQFAVKPKQLLIVGTEFVEEVTREITTIHFDNKDVFPIKIPKGIRVETIDLSLRPVVYNRFSSGKMKIFDISIDLDKLHQSNPPTLFFSDGLLEVTCPIDVRRINVLRER